MGLFDQQIQNTILICCVQFIKLVVSQGNLTNVKSSIGGVCNEKNVLTFFIPN